MCVVFTFCLLVFVEFWALCCLFGWVQLTNVGGWVLIVGFYLIDSCLFCFIVMVGFVLHLFVFVWYFICVVHWTVVLWFWLLQCLNWLLLRFVVCFLLNNCLWSFCLFFIVFAMLLWLFWIVDFCILLLWFDFEMIVCLKLVTCVSLVLFYIEWLFVLCFC